MRITTNVASTHTRTMATFSVGVIAATIAIMVLDLKVSSM
jgi:hypothetical protein